MAELEEKLLKNYPKQPLLWKRYIDDILCIWPGPQQELDCFIHYLNEAHPTIKFTHESSTHSVDFLDLTIYKGPKYTTTNILDIKPFFKKTNKFQYLQFNSAHPKNIFSGGYRGVRSSSDEPPFFSIQVINLLFMHCSWSRWKTASADFKSSTGA